MGESLRSDTLSWLTITITILLLLLLLIWVPVQVADVTERE